MRYVELIDGWRKRLGREVRIGFLGFGQANRAVLRSLPALTEHVTIRSEGEIVGDLPSGARLLIGKSALSDIDEDILFLSPSVRRDRPELLRARERGVFLTSECEAFFDGYTDAFCVTGSDGKSTTAAMAADMLGLVAVGNIGVPYSCADYERGCVAELSSFNLTYLAPRSRRCVITNITENHLDWHRDFDEYREAKKSILTNAESAVLSADDRECQRLAADGCYAVFSIRSDHRELARRFPALHFITLSDGWVCIDGERLASVSEMAHRESHNILNFMAAAGLAHGFTECEELRRVAREFKGLAHRGTVLRLCDIDFIDSSIDTTPARCRATLTSLNRRVRIILGGRGKGLSTEPLIEPLARYADVIGVYGDMRDELTELIKGDGRLRSLPFVSAVSLGEVIDGVCQGAREGDTVLLSPAGTSYGQFRSYAERGDYFNRYVKEKYKK